MQTCIHSKYEFTLIHKFLHFFSSSFFCSTFMLSFWHTRGSLCACAELPCWAIVTMQASWRPVLQLLPNPCCVPCLLSHCAIPGHSTMPTLQARSQHRGFWYHPGHTDPKKSLPGQAGQDTQILADTQLSPTQSGKCVIRSQLNLEGQGAFDGLIKHAPLALVKSTVLTGGAGYGNANTLLGFVSF